MLRVAILTISDSVASGARKDLSGPAVNEKCREQGWQVIATNVAPDETSVIQARLIEMCETGMVDVILTTGGTGIGPRDVTPEATYAICSKVLPGFGERMRAVGRTANSRADLSRALAGVRGNVLIVNLPGSPGGAAESLAAVADLLPHTIDVLRGARHD